MVGLSEPQRWQQAEDLLDIYQISDFEKWVRLLNLCYLNLPTKDLNKTKDFFSKIGFELNEQQTNEKMLCFTVGEKKMTVLFWDEETFKSFSKKELAGEKNGWEILISFDAESRQEIDETASKVFDAGGTILGEPAEIQGWMYGFAFADLDGQRWNMLYMDFAKMNS